MKTSKSISWSISNIPEYGNQLLITNRKWALLCSQLLLKATVIKVLLPLAKREHLLKSQIIMTPSRSSLEMEISSSVPLVQRKILSLNLFTTTKSWNRAAPPWKTTKCSTTLQAMADAFCGTFKLSFNDNLLTLSCVFTLFSFHFTTIWSILPKLIIWVSNDPLSASKCTLMHRNRYNFVWTRNVAAKIWILSSLFLKSYHGQVYFQTRLLEPNQANAVSSIRSW